MHYRPLTELTTHSVINQPPELGDLDLYASDRAFAEAVAREGSRKASNAPVPTGASSAAKRCARSAMTPIAVRPSFLPSTATAGDSTRCDSIPPITA